MTQVPLATAECVCHSAAAFFFFLLDISLLLGVPALEILNEPRRLNIWSKVTVGAEPATGAELSGVSLKLHPLTKHFE